MSYDEWVKTQPTPDYVTKAWNEMHGEGGLTEAKMRAWEEACQRASNEAHARYRALQDEFK